MTDKWPLHPSIMSYSIAEVEMTEVKEAVARIAEKMSRGGPASWVDVAFLLDHIEAVERERDELQYRIRSLEK